MNPFLGEHELIFKPIHVKVTRLLLHPFTYNIFRNKYAVSGIIYGILLALLGNYLPFENQTTPDFDQILSLQGIIYFLYVQPVLGLIVFGAIGTLMRIKKEYFSETYYALLEIADTDSLTTLFNNRYFKIRARELFHLAKRHEEEFCIIMYDIDNFKKVNDTYGHPEGDHILYEVAMILKKHSRSSDIPVRYGGEEFLLFLNRTSPKIGSIIAERIREAVDKQIIALSENNSMNVTVSGGIASFPVDGDQIEDLIKIADNRLYEAKDSGKNKIINKDGVIS